MTFNELKECDYFSYVFSGWKEETFVVSKVIKTTDAEIKVKDLYISTMDPIELDIYTIYRYNFDSTIAVSYKDLKGYKAEEDLNEIVQYLI